MIYWCNPTETRWTIPPIPRPPKRVLWEPMFKEPDYCLDLGNGITVTVKAVYVDQLIAYKWMWRALRRDLRILNDGVKSTSEEARKEAEMWLRLGGYLK